AKLIQSRTPGSVNITQPFNNGISDYKTAVEVIRNLLKKINNSGIKITKPTVYCCVSCDADDDERAKLEDVLMESGCKRIVLVDKPYAAAIGARLNIVDENPCMIVDIGSSSTEIAVFKSSQIISAVSINLAGKQFSNALAGYIRRKYNLFITSASAEQLKRTYGTVNPKHERNNAIVYGRNYSTGLPASAEITPYEIREILSRQIAKIAEAILIVLDDLSDEDAEYIMENGITISGGSAMLDGIDMLLNKYLEIPVTATLNPMDCVADGLERLINYNER
ncbi:MAG: rod shape-determining protein, partial [Oscillospiraceae bacterium]|nr:rod shape-determining protein [Oscillospiraceae bacterium]